MTEENVWKEKGDLLHMFLESNSKLTLKKRN